MKKSSLCALALLVFLAGVLVGRLCPEALVCASSGQAGAAAVQNGDTNGDGGQDISDAVYLLFWLFRGGPAPVPCTVDCPPRFVDHGDGTVTDSRTGLLWQKAPCDVNGDGMIDSEDSVGKEQAVAAAVSLVLGGHGGWELPNTAEFSTLIDIQDAFRRGIDPVFDCPEGISYWVSSTNAGDPCHGESFTIRFGMGGGFVGLGSYAYLRAVWHPPAKAGR